MAAVEARASRKTQNLSSTSTSSSSSKSQPKNLSNDLKWWLHLQPSFGNEHDSTLEQLIEEFDQPAEKHSAPTDIKTNAEFKKKEMGDTWEVDFDDNTCFDFESNLVGAEKSQPWWRTADGEELASLVARKKFENVENCDLPRPHVRHFMRGPLSSLEDFDRYLPLDGLRCSLSAPDRPSSNNIIRNVLNVPESDRSKARLLEALRHSQTRARKAEAEAEKLQAEKDHILRLIFKQASELFAYKQWLQMLQIGSKSKTIAIVFPLPNPQKNQMCRVGLLKCAFAVSFSLAAAGLLLGWNLGWSFSSS